MSKAKYIVLSIKGHKKEFLSHAHAFAYCETLDAKVKGVFRFRGLSGDNANAIGPINLTAGMFNGEYQKLQAKFPQFDYVVI